MRYVRGGEDGLRARYQPLRVYSWSGVILGGVSSDRVSVCDKGSDCL